MGFYDQDETDGNPVIFFGIHTTNVVKLADRIEQRVSLSAA